MSCDTHSLVYPFVKGLARFPLIQQNQRLFNVLYVVDHIQQYICLNQMEDIDDIFFNFVATKIINENEDPEPIWVSGCQKRHYWTKWKDAILTELDSLYKIIVFGPIVLTLEAVKPVGYRLVFVQKRNEKNEIVRYKARLVAQVFSQRPGINYEKIYSLVMDVFTFRYLISLVVSKNL